MTVDEAERRLDGALAKDANGRFAFACKRAAVAVRLRGCQACLQFLSKDNVGFRAEPQAFVIENLRTGSIVRQWPWTAVEWLVAGEPEMADGSLFQG